MFKNALKCYVQERIKMFSLIILNQCSLFSATLTSKMHHTESNKWPNASWRWTFDLFINIKFHKQKIISVWFTFMCNWLLFSSFLGSLVWALSKWALWAWLSPGPGQESSRWEWWSLLIQPWEVLETGGLEVAWPNLSPNTGTKTHTES